MLYVITPCRLIDTRGPVGPYGGPMAAEGQTRDIQVTGACGIPAGAKSIAANVTVVTPSTIGLLALYPSYGPWPGNSTVSYRTDRTRATSTTATLSSSGSLAVRNQGVNVHFIIDVTGYFY